MRFIRYLVLGALGIVLVTIAMGNREPLTVRLLPDELSRLLGVNWEITLPVFAVLLAAMLAGVALGFVWEWVREHKHRATAVTEKRARQKLEAQVKSVAPSEDSGDDVLALLENGSTAR